MTSVVKDGLRRPFKIAFFEQRATGI